MSNESPDLPQIALGPCPACYADGKARWEYEGRFRERHYWFIRCSGCGLITVSEEVPEWIAHHWNRRRAEPFRPEEHAPCPICGRHWYGGNAWCSQKCIEVARGYAQRGLKHHYLPSGRSVHETESQTRERETADRERIVKKLNSNPDWWARWWSRWRSA